jgi:hypothetical protein
MSQFALDPSNPLVNAWDDVFCKVFTDRRVSPKSSMARPDATSAHDQERAQSRDIPRSERAVVCPAGVLVAPPRSQCDIAIADWDILLCAVKERLRDSVSQPFATPLEPHLHDHAERIKSSVLECVDALDQIHQALLDALDRQQVSATPQLPPPLEIAP